MDMSAAELKRAQVADGRAQLPTDPAAEINGSEILVRCLQAEGVKHLWGYPGGAVLYIYDALYKPMRNDFTSSRRSGGKESARPGIAS